MKDLALDEANQLIINQAVRELIQGRTNAVGNATVTLRTGQTTTTVNDRLCGSGSMIDLMPTTANAAAALGTTYVSARSQFSFTLTHINNAQADRAFVYAVRSA